MSRRINFDETWGRLSDTVQKVITAAPLPRPVWNDKFSDIYSLCIAYPEALGESLYKETKTFLSSHVQHLCKDVCAHETDLLSSYAKHWKTYSQGAMYLNLLYHHFNHQYVRKSKQSDVDIEYGFVADDKEQMLEIKDLAMEAWREGMLEPLQHRLVSTILRDIARDREGKLGGESVHQVALYSLVAVEQHKKRNALKYYEDVFEKSFLQETGDFYRAKALELRDDSTCSEYMNKILSLLTDEEMRSRRFLHISSYKKTTLECQQRVIIDHIKFLQAGCRQMIRHNSATDLHHMYMLLKSVSNRLDSHILVSELGRIIKETGLDLVKGIKEGNVPLQFVETILEVHKRFHDVIRDTFHSDKLFVSAPIACNTVRSTTGDPKQQCRAPELVCKYCDAILRRCTKGPSNDADEKLQSSILVFRYIDEKDVFQKFYSRALARRLIHSPCAMDMEEMMINRLKGVCGYDFTSKLHCMFTDVRLSTELGKKYQETTAKTQDSSQPSINVNVLQAGAWPLTANQVEFVLPESLHRCLKQFEEFYDHKFNGRNLSWLHHLSQAEVRINFTSKPYLVSMSTYQLAIILLFNESTELTVSDISQNTKLKDKDLERNIAALTEANILLKTTQDKLEDMSVIRVNEKFSNKRTKFRVAFTQTQKEQSTEVQQTHTAVADDRKLYLQAAIVRIMKARKVLHHNTLMEEVINKSRIRFTPSVSAIKRSIEALIDKSYIERSPDSPDQYRYLA
ncbi:LOW QUALITY PROTEIN: cullin-2 [Ciona intestinalis]